MDSNRRMISKIGVSSHSKCFKVLHIWHNSESSCSFVSIAFLSDAVWQLRLEEPCFSKLSSPLNLITEGMFCSYTICCDISAEYSESVLDIVLLEVGESFNVVISSP